MSITDVSIRRPVLAWMIMASAILFGIIAIRRIGISQYPDVDYPNISVSVSWPGASPTAVEREILDPLEQAISQVEGVEEVQSQARQGSARITVTFDLSRNVDLALQDVQAKVAQAQRGLPKEVSSPTVSKSNPDDTPIITVGVSGPFAKQLLADVARYQVQEQLQTVPGVGQISINGYVDRNIRVWLDASKMAEKGVATSDILGAISREHVEMPGGQLDAGGRQVNVRLLGEALDLDSFSKIVVLHQNGTPIYLKDVALIEDGFEDRASIARLNGVPVQALGILKQRGTNAVEVAELVHERVDEIQKTLPDGMKVEVLADTTVYIEESVHEMEIELALAVLLTAAACWLFLGSLSSTLNVVLAIPMSLCGTVAVIYFCGFTLNTFTLLGLSLSIGLVVDDAIMVMENIFRHAEMGKDRVRAASEGTNEIMFAALAATLAIIAIFLPVIFMDGVVGKFFFQFGVTLSVSVAFSYFEAITLAPARCAAILDVSRAGRGRVGRAVDAAFQRLERFYARVLGASMKRPFIVLAVAGLLIGMATYVFIKTPSEFVPTQDQSSLNVRLTTEIGTSLDAAEPLLSSAEGWIRDQPEVESTLTTLSNNAGRITITLVPPNKRKLSAAEFSTKVRTELGKIAGLRVSVQDPSQLSFGSSRGYPVDFTVRGADWDTLVTTAMKAKDELEASGQVVDLTTDYQVGAPEVQITPDRRRASELGVSVQTLASTVNALVAGSTVGQFETGGRRIDIRTRALAKQRSRPEDIGDLTVRTQTGDLVPLSLLVTQDERPVLQAITRINRERAIRIRGNVAPGKTQSQVLETVRDLAKEMPTGYHVVFGGQATQLEDTASSLIFALIIGILVAYMVLASQFNSFLHPITVLTILPLAVCGAAIGLFATGATLNLFSMIGILLLMGIVKKNSILLVEYAHQLQEHESLDAMTAMLRAGPLRLRPILMTTFATMMAAVPAVLGLGPGSETRGPMAAAVLGGLGVSTMLSLLVVPAFYLLADRAKNRLLKRRASPPAPPAPPTHDPAGPPAEVASA